MAEYDRRVPHLDHSHPPGIFFADDPAFQGRPRELVAADYVYALKRFADPRTRVRRGAASRR
jgi:hypothetical protein